MLKRLAIAGLCIAAGLSGEEGYVDSAVCATCHAREWQTYQKTGMARSFYKPAPSNQVEDYSKNNSYYHKPSDTWYTMAVRDGRYYQAQYQIGVDGKQTGYYEKEIEYIVGSGNHTRTYLARGANNSLIELPLAWYAEKGGYWAMNPGYDRPNHDGLGRHIQYNCMFCHNAYPDMTGVSTEWTGEAAFPAKLPEGIDCQRCHGPGKAHVESAQNRRGTIVNPARLSPQRQAEVCEQCHLETTSFPLPNSLIRYERGQFSYRPGEPLADFKLDFDHAPGTGYDDDFEIASSAYQLNKSQCVLKSAAGKLTCTTCHNPHDIQHGATAEASYNAVCQTCHTGTQHVSAGDCVSCHMPKRRTNDVVHVVMTDHRIQRNKPARDLLADIAERSDMYRGEVVAYRPLTKPDDELYLATAQVIEGSNLGHGIPRLAAAIRDLKPEGADHYVDLADALRTANRCAEAVPIYQNALRRSPGAVQTIQKMALCAPSSALLRPVLEKAPHNAKLWTQLGVDLVREGKMADGIAAFEKATSIDPDVAEAWNDLGGIREETGERRGAEEAFRNAIRVEPNYLDAHINLGNLLANGNRFDEAKYQFEEALHLKPDFAFAHFGYGLALGRAGKYEEARGQLEQSLKEDPTAETHEALGMVLTALGNSSQAMEHYREAVRLRPDFDRANLSLGDALVSAGKAAEASSYLRQAAQSKDATVRTEAQRLLDKH